jgi:hypothetical protein
VFGIIKSAIYIKLLDIYKTVMHIAISLSIIFLNPLFLFLSSISFHTSSGNIRQFLSFIFVEILAFVYIMEVLKSCGLSVLSKVIMIKCIKTVLNTLSILLKLRK